MDDQKIYREGYEVSRAHIINQQVLDITLGSTRDPEAIQRELSRVYNRILVPLIEAELTEASGSRTILIDRLELDLGDIELGSLERDITARLKEQLGRELQKHTSRKASRRSSIQAKAETGLSLLEHFLLHGTYPWWVSSSNQPNIEDVLIDAIRVNGAGTIAILKTTGRLAHARKRMVNRFNEKLLVKIVGLLEPGQAEFIIDYAGDLQELHEKKPVANINAPVFRKAKWEFIFSWLLVERGTIFNTRAFVKSTIMQMAGRYNIGYADLLRFLRDAVNDSTISFAPRSALPSILLDIHKEEFNEADEADDISGIIEDKLNTLLHFLRFGSIPHHAGAVSAMEIRNMLETGMNERPHYIIQVLRDAAGRPGVIKRFAHTYNDMQVRRVIRFAEPSHAVFIISYADSLQALHEKSSIVRATAAEFSRVKWELVLTHLFTERGSAFNTKAFIESTVRKLAGRYSVKYSDLLLALDEGLNVKALSPALRSTLPSLIRSLAGEEQARAEKAMDHITAPLSKAANAMIHRDALDFFFREGKLPWWYKESGYPAAAQLAIAMLANHPADVTRMLLRAGARTPHHIVMNFRERLILRIIILLEPVHGQTMIRQTRALNRVQQQSPIVHQRASAFSNIVMEVTLTYLLADRGSHFNTRSYIRYTLHRLAAHYNLRYIDLLRHIQGSLQMIDGSNVPFTEAITGLYEEESVNERSSGRDQPREKGNEENIVQGSQQDDSLEAGRIIEWLDNGAPSERSIMQEELSNEWKLLSDFMLTGIWTGVGSVTLYDLVVKLASEDDGYYLRRMSQLLSNRNVRENLLKNWPATQRTQLIKLLTARELSFILPYSSDVRLVLEHFHLQGVSSARLHNWIYEICLGIIAYSSGKSKAPVSPASFVTAILRSIASRANITFPQLLLQFDSEARKLHGELSSQLPFILAAIRKKDELNGSSHNVNDKEGEIPAAGKKKKGKHEEPRDKADDIEEEQHESLDAMYVSNAGLVMLAPYLLKYFEMLGLTENRQFRDDSAASKGVYMLQYLATGRCEEGYEHLLGLNKLLCGKPTYWPVEEFTGFTGREKEITDQMLSAVIKNWDAMKNTSAGSFQESFLQRNGKLHQEEKAWVLKVEKKTFDVLLANLPWSFGTIRFPWMEKIIQVEWK